MDDLKDIHAIESNCFPPGEAASLSALSKRLQIFPDHFWVLEAFSDRPEDDTRILGYINGMVTDHTTIRDEMFEDAGLHDNQGQWQSVFGLAVAEAEQKKGYAGQLIRHLIEQAQKQHRTGITLTCKQHLIPYYGKFGFKDLGISASVHGGAVWHDMVFYCG